MTKPKSAQKYVTMRALAASEVRLAKEIGELRGKLAETPWRAEFEVLNQALADMREHVATFDQRIRRAETLAHRHDSLAPESRPVVLKVTLTATEGEEDY